MSRIEQFTFEKLPSAVAGYLRAHSKRDLATAGTFLAPDATLTDGGVKVIGRDAVVKHLQSISNEFEYETDFLTLNQSEGGDWDIATHAVGSFPAGLADFNLVFSLDGEAVSKLVVYPRGAGSA